MQDYESLRGIFEIDSAYKFEKGSATEWHCISTHSKYEYVVILYTLGLIRVKVGETEYDVTYGDRIYMVGKVKDDGELEVDKGSRLYENLLNKPQINIHDILTFMEWNYHIGYV